MNPLHKAPSLAAAVGAIDHRAGPEHARVVLVEYADFECPACVAAEPALRQLRAEYQSSLEFVFRHFPMEQAHAHALMAAEAAEAAGAQGKFWEMHDLLLSGSRELNRRHLEECAMRIDLDMTRFKAEMDDEVYRQRIREHQEGGRRSHVRATPGFFLNGVMQEIGAGTRALLDSVAAAVRRAYPN